MSSVSPWRENTFSELRLPKERLLTQARVLTVIHTRLFEGARRARQTHFERPLHLPSRRFPRSQFLSLARNSGSFREHFRTATCGMMCSGWSPGKDPCVLPRISRLQRYLVAECFLQLLVQPQPLQACRNQTVVHSRRCEARVLRHSA